MEIIESILIENNEFIRGKMFWLRVRNIDLYIDDFGMGYFFFNYLYNFLMNILKIDCLFINRIGFINLVNNKLIKIIEIFCLIIILFYNLGINVVVEGVEILE